jgi:hypothetical protein
MVNHYSCIVLVQFSPLTSREHSDTAEATKFLAFLINFILGMTIVIKKTELF